MAVELNINGNVNLTFKHINSNDEVNSEIEKKILNELQRGNYIIGINDKHVFFIGDLLKPIYSFEIETTDYLEYDFDEL